ncbi:hypothetical protein [Weissella koreensis]|nr:hypothetical protein [Weissella koreensis]
MRSRLDKNNSNKSQKKIIIISIVAVLFAVMLMITMASLSIAGKSSIEAESAKQNKRSKKVSSSSQASSEKSVSISTSNTSISTSVSSSSESVKNNGVTDDEQSMYFTRMRIGLSVGKAIYSDNGKDTPKLDHFEEIPGGFKIYFVDGMLYKVRDTGFYRNLASEYNLGNDNHRFELYFDDKPAITLKMPQGQLGGAFDVTPDMLKQYAIR